MRTIAAAAAALADDPYPSEGFHRGRYHRLRVGQYRVMYVIDGDEITVERVGDLDAHAVGRVSARPSRRLPSRPQGAAILIVSLLR
jgi:hypothetical protein